MAYYKNIKGTSKDDTINGTNKDDFIDGKAGNDIIHGKAGNDKILGGAGNDKLYGDAGKDVLHGDSGKNTLVGGADADSYYLTKGTANVDTVAIAKGDSLLSFAQLSNIVKTGVVTGIDKIYGLDKSDKIDLDIKGIAANANVNTTIDTAHFKNYSIKDGILTLKNGNVDVNINSKALLKEAFDYASKNIAVLPHDAAVGVKVNVEGSHTLIIVNHSTPGATVVDVVGTLNALTHDQVF